MPPRAGAFRDYRDYRDYLYVRGRVPVKARVVTGDGPSASILTQGLQIPCRLSDQQEGAAWAHGGHAKLVGGSLGPGGPESVPLRTGFDAVNDPWARRAPFSCREAAGPREVRSGQGG